MLIYVTIIVNDKEAMNLIGVREEKELEGEEGKEGCKYGTHIENSQKINVRIKRNTHI